jgi:lysozyme family protein
LSAQSVKKISHTEVRDIYKKRYWDIAFCNLLPQKLAISHFDWAVNAGVNRAIKTLQQVVGVSSDGRVGPLTLQAIIAATAKNKEYELCDRYNAVRESCYRRWGVGSQAVFLAGWMNRLNALRRELKSSA